MACLLAASTTFGQSNTSTDAPPPTVQGGLQEIVDAATTGTNRWVASVLGEWAKSAPKNPFGARANLLYEATENILVGPSVEYLNGQAEYVSGNATLKAELNPHIAFDPSLRLTPWGYVGAGIPFGTHKTVTVAGEAAAGLQARLWQSANGRWSAGLLGGVEKRTDIPGQIYLGGADITYKFGAGK